MKLPLAILFSPLLLAAQTFAVAVPVSGGPAEAESGCCETCVHCTCCVTESEGAPIFVPQPAPPVRSICQFLLVPCVSFWFELPATAADRTFSHREASLTTVQPPLFQRNCVFLI
ncbi:MAG: hypothetical protein ACK45B_12935 [Limisphaerales bacterium]